MSATVNDYTQTEALGLQTGALGFKRLAAATRHVAADTSTPSAWSATSGPELVTNGSFAADSNWTKGTGWTIAAGAASSDGSQTGDSDLEQAVTLADATAYRTSFTVSSRSAGNVTMTLGGVEGTDRAANGTFNEVITVDVTDKVIIRADADFVGNVGSVSVKLANSYTIGDYVEESGSYYVCIQSHTVDEATDKPGSGGSWEDYWKLLELHPLVREFVRLKAIGGATTFGGGCVAVAGDVPAASDTLRQDDELWCRMTSVDITSGVVYAYYR